MLGSEAGNNTTLVNNEANTPEGVAIPPLANDQAHLGVQDLPEGVGRPVRISFAWKFAQAGRDAAVSPGLGWQGRQTVPGP